VVVPFQLVTPRGVLSFISTTTIFGTPVDVTLQELAVESFFPADAQTANALSGLAGRSYQFAFNRLDMMSSHELQGVVDEDIDRG